jgi:hypothetical protein
MAPREIKGLPSFLIPLPCANMGTARFVSLSRVSGSLFLPARENSIASLDSSCPGCELLILVQVPPAHPECGSR